MSFVIVNRTDKIGARERCQDTADCGGGKSNTMAVDRHVELKQILPDLHEAAGEQYLYDRRILERIAHAAARRRMTAATGQHRAPHQKHECGSNR